jgi:release factor glutamine methyltransferase
VTTSTSGDDGTITWRQLWAETDPLVAGQGHGRAVARWLCEEASGADGAEFLELLDVPATERTVHHLDAMVARVRAGEPVQYVLGHWAFRRLDLLVDRRVLIPRPETEQLVELALTAARAVPLPRTCVDLGTGSGAIGLSLVAELPLDGTTVWLTDASPDALDVARANAAGLGRRSVNARFAEGSWFDALPAELRGAVDIVVANPPYIADHDPAVEQAVRDWEPLQALYAGPDGLDAVRVIARDAVDWLVPEGVLLIEIGHDQRDAVTSMLHESGLVDAQVLADLAGRDRFAVARAAPAQPNRAAT